MPKPLSPEQYLQAREKLLSCVPTHGARLRSLSKQWAYWAVKIAIIPPTILLTLLFFTFNDLSFHFLSSNSPHISFNYFGISVVQGIFWGLVICFAPPLMSRLAPKYAAQCSHYMDKTTDYLAITTLYYLNTPFHDFRNEIYHNRGARYALFNPQHQSMLVNWLKGRNEWGEYEMWILDQLLLLEIGLNEYLKTPKPEDDQQKVQAFYDRTTSYRQAMPDISTNPGSLRERLEELLIESQVRHNRDELQSTTPPIHNSHPPTRRL